MILIVVLIGTSFIYEIKHFPLKQEISIVSYNIHSGFDKDMFPTLFDIIDFLKVSDSDIICMQEVNESAKAGFQVSSFKEELGMYSHFAANVVDLGANYGLATYSKFPIKDKNHVYLTSAREQRGLLHTVVSIKGKNLNIINLHLGLEKKEREIQLSELVEFIDTLGDEPYIVVGDFNQADLSLDSNKFKDAAIKLNKSNILTLPIGLNRIDYILVSPDVEVLDYNVLIKNMSDHFPIIATIRI